MVVTRIAAEVVGVAAVIACGAHQQGAIAVDINRAALGAAPAQVHPLVVFTNEIRRRAELDIRRG